MASRQTNSLIQEIRKKWPSRKKNAHKGDFGRVFILAGSRGMAGAVYLASVAALRTGAGLVTLGVPDAIYSVWARKIPEVMVYPFPSTSQGTIAYRAKRKILEILKRQTVFACGPGLSQNFETAKLIRELVLKTSLPQVLDADGLNAFQNHSKLISKFGSQAILTPHPGEFQRLFGTKPGTQLRERVRLALDAAQKTKSTILLKGAGTVIADSKRTSVNPTGNPGLAKGGSGDVLTGMIAALLSQGFDCWDAARFGAFLHGLTADLAVKKTGEASLTAGDLLDFLPFAIRKTRGC